MPLCACIEWWLLTRSCQPASGDLKCDCGCHKRRDELAAVYEPALVVVAQWTINRGEPPERQETKRRYCRREIEHRADSAERGDGLGSSHSAMMPLRRTADVLAQIMPTGTTSGNVPIARVQS